MTGADTFEGGMEIEIFRGDFGIGIGPRGIGDGDTAEI